MINSRIYLKKINHSCLLLRVYLVLPLVLTLYPVWGQSQKIPKTIELHKLVIPKYENNKLVWELRGKDAKFVDQNSDDILIIQPTIFLYDKANQYTLTANKAFYRPTDKKCELEEDVLCISDNNLELKTMKMSWYTEKQTLLFPTTFNLKQERVSLESQNGSFNVQQNILLSTSPTEVLLPAAPKTQSSPITIQSQKGLTLKGNQKSTSFKGQVLAQYETFKLKCDQLEIEASENQEQQRPKKLHGRGHVHLEDTSRKLKASGDEIIYSQKKGRFEIWSKDPLKTKLLLEYQKILTDKLIYLENSNFVTSTGLTHCFLSRKEKSQKEPEEITIQCSQGMKAYLEENKIIFKGQVELKQKEFELKCDELVLYLNKTSSTKEISHLFANGHVRCKEHTKSIHAQSEKMNYDLKTKNIRFWGEKQNAHLNQSGRTLDAKSIDINIETGKLRATSVVFEL